jgi:hypothetical protein
MPEVDQPPRRGTRVTVEFMRRLREIRDKQSPHYEVVADTVKAVSAEPEAWDDDIVPHLPDCVRKFCGKSPYRIVYSFDEYELVLRDIMRTYPG